MPHRRTVISAKPSHAAIEGAGVHLRRAFGHGELPRYDPFLLLDDFRGDDPSRYLAGFPWHPHRGMETITYMLEGSVEHADSLGNRGVIGPGGVQWMSAGSGIIHQEMPRPSNDGRMGGFQLWANLPAIRKMTPPRYQEFSAGEIPEVDLDAGRVRVIAGTVNGTRGPVRDVAIAPTYLDIHLDPRRTYAHGTEAGHTVFAYLYEGEASFDVPPSTTSDGQAKPCTAGTLLLFDDGDAIRMSTGADPARLLLISGMPLKETVAWGGPIVMNTQEELQTAFAEYQNGSFVRNPR